jgi:hypothetical protein
MTSIILDHQMKFIKRKKIQIWKICDGNLIPTSTSMVGIRPYINALSAPPAPAVQGNYPIQCIYIAYFTYLYFILRLMNLFDGLLIFLCHYNIYI